MNHYKCNKDYEELMKMKLSPFYLMPVPEDAIDRLFIDREKEIKTINRILGQRATAIIGVLGGPGVGKSSILNMISAICVKHKFGVDKTTIKDYSPQKVSTTKEDIILLIDDVNTCRDDDAITFYEKIAVEKRLVFFADNLKRPMDVIRERNLITTHASIVLPEGLDSQTCEDFLRKRLENFSEKYRFTRESVLLATKRSSGNLRSFLKYCGTAWTMTDGSIKAENMQDAILEIDKENLYALSDADKEIIRILNVKHLNVSQLHHELREKHDIKMTRVTLDSKLSNLEQLGLLISEKKGYEVRYKTIYSDINMPLPDF